MKLLSISVCALAACPTCRLSALPDVAQRFRLDGAEAVGSTPKEFAAFLKAEMQKWSKVIRNAGIKLTFPRFFVFQGSGIKPRSSAHAAS